MVQQMCISFVDNTEVVVREVDHQLSSSWWSYRDGRWWFQVQRRLRFPEEARESEVRRSKAWVRFDAELDDS